MGICIKCHQACGITQYYGPSYVELQTAPHHRWTKEPGLFVCESCGGQPRFRLYEHESFTDFVNYFEEAPHLLPWHLRCKYLRGILNAGGQVYFFDVGMHLLSIDQHNVMHIGDDETGTVYIQLEGVDWSELKLFKEMMQSMIITLPENED